jgi:hypothetical protein
MHGMSPTYDQGMEPKPSGGGVAFPFITVVSPPSLAAALTTTWVAPKDGFYDFFVWGPGGNGTLGASSAQGGGGGGFSYAREYLARGASIPIEIDAQSLTTGSTRVFLPKRTLTANRGVNAGAGGTATGGDINSSGGAAGQSGVNGAPPGTNNGGGVGGGGAGGHPQISFGLIGMGGQGYTSSYAMLLPGHNFGGGGGGVVTTGGGQALAGACGGVIITGTTQP